MKVLFVCTGNSCRSQMAEGWLRALGGDRYAVRSAGLEAQGLNPLAVAAMAESGVDIAGQSSSELDDADLEWADLVVTVCGNADEHCPVLPPGTTRLHWPIPDPAGAEGSPEQVRQVFANVRDEVRLRVGSLLESVWLEKGGALD